MSLLSTATVRSDKIVFAQSFEARRYVQDAMGTLVGCNVGLRGPGIIPTGITSRVTYDRTQSLLINATQMTIRLRFRVGATVPAANYLLFKAPIALNDNQFMVMFSAGQLICFLPTAAADLGTYIGSVAPVVANTEYIYHVSYNGGLAPGSRAFICKNGQVDPSGVAGAIPASLRANNSPLVVFQAAGGVGNAPPTDFTLFDCKLWAASLLVAECLDDALNRTYGAP